MFNIYRLLELKLFSKKLNDSGRNQSIQIKNENAEGKIKDILFDEAGTLAEARATVIFFLLFEDGENSETGGCYGAETHLH